MAQRSIASAGGDDMNNEGVRSFNELAGTEANEPVMFAWVVVSLARGAGCGQ